MHHLGEHARHVVLGFLVGGLAALQVAAYDDPTARNVQLRSLTMGAVVPTYNPRIVDFVSARVGNYQYHPQWGVLLDQLWVK